MAVLHRGVLDSLQLASVVDSVIAAQHTTSVASESAVGSQSGNLRLSSAQVSSGVQDQVNKREMELENLLTRHSYVCTRTYMYAYVHASYRVLSSHI